MDLRVYYQKVRDVAARIGEEFPVVVSKETADGGQEGIKTEVPKNLAAKLIVEGTAELAKPEEAAKFRAALAEAKRMAEQATAAAKLQLTVLSTAELDALKVKPRGTRE